MKVWIATASDEGNLVLTCGEVVEDLILVRYDAGDCDIVRYHDLVAKNKKALRGLYDLKEVDERFSVGDEVHDAVGQLLYTFHW